MKLLIFETINASGGVCSLHNTTKEMFDAAFEHFSAKDKK